MHSPHDPFAMLNQYVNVSHETFDKLNAYSELLIKWQKSINLVSNASLDDAWNRHFLDSLQLLKFIHGEIKTIVDLGSGAGFPALVIAMASNHNVHVIESDAKKISFMREVARVTNTSIELHHARIEDVIIDNADVVTSRAFSSLEHIFECAKKIISHETICLFHKGKNYSNEIESANSRWAFSHVAFPSVSDAQGMILQLSHVRERKHGES